MSACPACKAENPDRAKFCLECGTAMVASAAAVEVRKTVTVLFCDVTGSTALGERLDAEAMRSVMTRYFATMRRVVESHGGTVEKFIGDAVMAVFGVPVLHEDDALRALRAADGMRGALADLNDGLERDHGVRLAARIGVNTGEVVVGTGTEGDRGTVATGDAVNVAARLEQAAGTGEVLFGTQTWELVRGAVDAERVAPLTLKGKAEGVPAWRLLGVDTSSAPAPRVSVFSSPLVGRSREVQLLEQALDRSTADRRSQLVTVLGAAGVGKSRLVAELLAGLDEHATVLSGRCLSYGEDIVFWPLLQMLRQAAGLTAGGDDEAGRRQLRSLLADDAEADRVVERLAPLAGLSGTPAEADETQWAVRRLVEALGQRGAVVVVLDDVHWAEPALLDVVEHLADWTRDTPLLLVCLARPEFLDDRPQWGGGKLNATAVLLEPLGAGAAADLLDNLLGGATVDPGTRDRILDAAGGMPLFVEQMLAMLVDDGLLVRDGDAWSSTGDLAAADVPPTITALLAARLDRLPAGERAALEAGSVIGLTFYRDAVAELAPVTPGEAGRFLLALTRKELVRPDRSDLPGEDGFRFLHVLLRDAAYAAIPKARRAELHESFARWLDKRSETLGLDTDEFVGLHLEQAVRLRRELGPTDLATGRLADQAAARLAAAAARLAAADPASAGSLYDRAAALLEPGRPQRLDHLRAAGGAAMQAGDLAASRGFFETATDEATVAGDDRRAELARISLLGVRLHLDPDLSSEERLPEVDRALARFRAAGDDEGVLTTGLTRMNMLNELATWGPMVSLADELLVVAERTGDELKKEWLARFKRSALFFGPAPIEECLAWLDVSEKPVGRLSELADTYLRAASLAYLGRFDEARAFIAQGDALLADIATPIGGGFAAFGGGIAHVCLGDLESADRMFRGGVEAMRAIGERAWLSTLAPMLGGVRYALGDLDEARELADLGRELSPPADIVSQALWRSLSARIQAAEGDLDAAVDLADEAVRWIERSDQSDSIAHMHAARGEVLERAGRLDEAVADLRTALEWYLRKGHQPGARLVRQRLSALGGLDDGTPSGA